MGLFDSLKKNLGDIQKTIETNKDDLLKEIEKLGVKPEQTQSAPQAQPQQNDYSQPFYEEESVYPHAVNDGSVDQFAKFEGIIERNFADCEVKKNVPASELKADCHPACTPVQFMFYKNGAPALAVVLVKTNNYRGRNVKGTQDICKANGINYIRFYQEYENAEDYVVNRIKENL